MRDQGKDRGGAVVNVSTIGTALPTIVNNVHYDSSEPTPIRSPRAPRASSAPGTSWPWTAAIR